MRILRARLLAAAQEEADAEASDARRSQVRTVDRSERIRTYNFPENRISDHRVGYKAYNLDQVLDGDLAAGHRLLRRRRPGRPARGARAVTARREPCWPARRRAAARRPASPAPSTTPPSCSRTSSAPPGRGCRWSTRSPREPLAAYDALVARRAAREPLQHLTGRGVLPLPRARGRPGRLRARGPRPRCSPAGRSTRRAPDVERRRSSSTCAPARAPSRWRSPTRCPAPACTPSSSTRAAHAWAAAQPAPAPASTCATATWPTALRRPGRHGRPGHLQPAVHPARRLGVRRARGPRPRPARSRSGPATTAWTRSGSLERARGRLLRPGGVVGVEHADAAGRVGARGLRRRPGAGPTSATTATWPVAPRFTDRATGTMSPRDDRARSGCPTGDRRDEREAAVDGAPASAVRRGELVVLPDRHRLRHRRRRLRPRRPCATLLEAKGRGRDMPPPVLVGSADHARRARRPAARLRPGAGRGVLARRADPGLPASSPRCSGTSATPGARSPCGCPTTRSPSSCSSAPARWRSAAPTSPARRPRPTPTRPSEMLGDDVAVILDARPEPPGGEASTIIDVTGDQGRVLRRGALVARAAQRGARAARRHPDGRGLSRAVREYLLVFLVAAAVDLPADRRRPRDRAAHRRGRRGPRPRRARRADPVPRRAGDARRPGGGVPRRRQLPFLSDQRPVRLPRRRRRAHRRRADLRGRRARRPLRARRAHQARRPGARGRLPDRARASSTSSSRHRRQPVLRSTRRRARCSPASSSSPPSTP